MAVREQEQEPTAPMARALAIAILGPIVVALALVPVRDHIRTANVSLVLVVVVLVAAIVGGRVGGGLAAIVAAVSYDFFFTRPYNSFTINRADDVETTVLLLIVGVAVGEIVLRSRRHRRVAERRTQEIGHMRRMAELSAGNEPIGRLIHILQGELIELLGLHGCRFERPPFHTVLPQLQHGRVSVPATEEPAGIGPRNEVELPVWGAGRQVGRFVLELSFEGTGVAIKPDDRALAVALADQLGAVLAGPIDSSV